MSVNLKQQIHNSYQLAAQVLIAQFSLNCILFVLPALISKVKVTWKADRLANLGPSQGSMTPGTFLKIALDNLFLPLWDFYYYLRVTRNSVIWTENIT